MSDKTLTLEQMRRFSKRYKCTAKVPEKTKGRSMKQPYPNNGARK